MNRSSLESNISVNVSRSKKIDRFEAKEDGSLRKFIFFFVFYEENHCCGSIARTVCVIHAIRESEVTRTKKKKSIPWNSRAISDPRNVRNSESDESLREWTWENELERK